MQYPPGGTPHAAVGRRGLPVLPVGRVGDIVTVPARGRVVAPIPTILLKEFDTVVDPAIRTVRPPQRSELSHHDAFVRVGEREVDFGLHRRAQGFFIPKSVGGRAKDRVSSRVGRGVTDVVRDPLTGKTCRGIHVKAVDHVGIVGQWHVRKVSGLAPILRLDHQPDTRVDPADRGDGRRQHVVIPGSLGEIVGGRLIQEVVGNNRRFIQVALGDGRPESSQMLAVNGQFGGAALKQGRTPAIGFGRTEHDFQARRAGERQGGVEGGQVSGVRSQRILRRGQAGIGGIDAEAEPNNIGIRLGEQGKKIRLQKRVGGADTPHLGRQDRRGRHIAIRAGQCAAQRIGIEGYDINGAEGAGGSKQREAGGINPGNPGGGLVAKLHGDAGKKVGAAQGHPHAARG